MAEWVTIEVVSIVPETKHDRYVHAHPENHNVTVEQEARSVTFDAQATWKIVPSLLDPTNKDLVSVESAAFPATYLRHINGVVSRFPNEVPTSAEPFLKDASWHLRVGLSDPKGFSFESVNKPGLFITVAGDKLIIEQPAAPEASTFVFAPPLFRIVPNPGILPPDYKTLAETSWAGAGFASQGNLPNKDAALAWFLPQREKDRTINLLTWTSSGGGKAWLARSTDVTLSPYKGYTTWQWEY